MKLKLFLSITMKSKGVIQMKCKTRSFVLRGILIISLLCLTAFLLYKVTVPEESHTANYVGATLV